MKVRIRNQNRHKACNFSHSGIFRPDRPSLRYVKALAMTVFVCLLCIPARGAFAQKESLKDLMMSDKVRNMNNVAGGYRESDAKWLPPGSNIELLFSRGPAGAGILLDWVGEIVAGGFSLKRKTPGLSREFAQLAAVYGHAEGEVHLTILVPHPKHAELVQMRLIEKFREFDPPHLKIQSVEKFTVKGNSCFLYNHKEGGASLLCRLPGEGLLNIYTASYENAGNIMRFAELINISRLKQKIES